METINQVIHMISPNCYPALLDIKDAFYIVPIYKQHKKYLKFLNTGIAYQFEVKPNEYLDAIRVFTKILKPPFSCLREQGHSSVIYVDDSLFAGDIYKDCLDNIHETKLLLERLGYFLPTQVIAFLGFEINTVNMAISLTNAKKNKIKDLCVTTLSNPTLTIRQVASLLGNIAASLEVVPYGRLHYRYLEQNKIVALTKARGNFENPCTITREASKDIIWWGGGGVGWVGNILDAIASLHPTTEAGLAIFIDASNKGWGASTNDQTINGR